MIARKSREAFTLIELLLVLVILAVLAAVIVPKFTNRSKDAKITRAKSDIHTLEQALDTYEIDNGEYPNSQQGLAALVEAPSGAKTGRGLTSRIFPTTRGAMRMSTQCRARTTRQATTSSATGPTAEKAAAMTSIAGRLSNFIYS